MMAQQNLRGNTNRGAVRLPGMRRCGGPNVGIVANGAGWCIRRADSRSRRDAAHSIPSTIILKEGKERRSWATSNRTRWLSSWRSS